MYKLIRPVLFRFSSDYIHEKTLAVGKSLSSSWLKKPIEFMYGFGDESLNTTVFGIDFPNPIGLAAGFDKNGELLDLLPSLGFGFVEIGSITAQPSKGNQKPRTFRLPKDKALINKTGLPNKGTDNVYDDLNKKEFDVPVGINIAASHNPSLRTDVAISDVCYSFLRLYNIGDYIAINISCPNIPGGKEFEDKYALNDLLRELNKIQSDFLYLKPVLLKLSPDLSYHSIDDILDIAETCGINGYVISNTSLEKYDLKTNPKKINKLKGGLSGLPLKNKSTDLIKYVHKHLGNPIIIGSGGVFSARDAYEKIRAGASLIQVYTGLIYQGPGFVKRINKGLVKILKREDISSLKEIIGIDAK